MHRLARRVTARSPVHRWYLTRPLSSMAAVSETVDPWRPHVVPAGTDDWVADVAGDLADAANFHVPGATKTHKPRILVLYGSLRETSFSRFMAYECARLLDVLGADVRVFNPKGLPVRDPSVEATDPKVAELRELVLWSEGHVWVSPEMHGNITGVMKNQIDWIPLNTGSVRPTQGKTAVVLQVNGGSQSFNAVNALRVLARWMRMPCCTNQSSVPMAWKEFEHGRMKPSDFRDRVVDVMEEFYKFTLVMREHADFLVDRYSERKEKAAKGRLLTQAEKEAAKDAAKKTTTETAAEPTLVAPDVLRIEPKELGDLLRSDADGKPVVVDVRDPLTSGGYVKGAINVPKVKFDDVEYVDKFLEEHGRNGELLVFYCNRSNGRGPTAAGRVYDRIVEKHGASSGLKTQVRVLKGGVKAFLETYGSDNALVDPSDLPA